jgi:hypothetical protein
MVNRLKEGNYKRRIIFSLVIAFLFALSIIAGYQLQGQGYTDSGVKGKALILIKSLALSVPIFPFSYGLFYLSERINIKSGQYDKAIEKKIYLISALIIFVFYIPAFLAYYPAILSYDFHRQAGMAMHGFPYYWRLHPYLSTLEISAFLHLGIALGSTTIGMALLALFHMVLTALAFSYVSATIYSLTGKKYMAGVATALFSLLPFFQVLTMCTTKDIIFTDLVAVFLCLTARRLYLCEDKKKEKIYVILIVLEGIMMCLWRNNAVYAVVAAGLVLFVIISGKRRFSVLLMAIAILVGTSLSNRGMKLLLKEHFESDAVEMLSIVYQTMGRVETKHRNELTPDDKLIITKYIPDYAWDGYLPAISDPIKGSIGGIYNSNYRGKFPQLFKDWITLGLRYPNDYIDAFLDLTRGYWYIKDISFANCLGEGNGMGIIYTYYSSASDVLEEIPLQSKLPYVYQFYEKLISDDVVLKIPLINQLFRPAFYTWIVVLVFAVNLYRKKKLNLYHMAFPIMYILTMLLGPVVQFRYAYPWIVGSILLVPMAMISKEEELIHETT